MARISDGALLVLEDRGGRPTQAAVNNLSYPEVPPSHAVYRKVESGLLLQPRLGAQHRPEAKSLLCKMEI